jgi:hypothetical protein
MRDIEIIQTTIAICKREVELVIGPELLQVVDQGSPWGRAFMMAVKECKELASSERPESGAVSPIREG